MEFRIFLDGTDANGTEVFDVEGLDELEEVIERDDKIKGLILKYPTDFTFTGDAYAYLFSKKESGGFCQMIQLYVVYRCTPFDSWQVLLDGNVFLTDVVFTLNDCEAKVPFEDNSYSARIFNNRKVEVPLSGRASKNGVPIGYCPFVLWESFYPSSGFYTGEVPPGYDLFEVFKYFIRWMSDDTIGFVSDFFSTLPDDENVLIVKGSYLRFVGITEAPVISFQDFFDEVYKKYNIFFSMEVIGGVPTMRIEPLGYFFKTPNVLRADYIPHLDESFFQASLYSSVEVGADKFANLDGALQHSLSRVAGLTHIKESYSLSNNCNIDEKLDLVGKYISDTNLIEEIIVNDTATYDDEIFFIQYTKSTGLATQGFYSTDNVSAVPALYNEQLLNTNVLKRFNFHANVIQYLADNPDDHFRASSTSATAPSTTSEVIVPFAFQNDYTSPNFDTNNNYGNGTVQGNPVSQANSRYTAPVNSVYSVIFSLFVDQYYAPDQEVFPGNIGTYTLRIRRFNAANVLLDTKPISFDEDGATQFSSKNFILSPNIYLEATDYIVAEIEYSISGSAYAFHSFLTGSFFAVTAISDTGGTFQTNPSQLYYSRKFEFDYPVSQVIWEEMKANPAKSMLINIDGHNNKQVWINKVSRNTKDSLCKFVCISNIANAG